LKKFRKKIHILRNELINNDLIRLTQELISLINKARTRK